MQVTDEEKKALLGGAGYFNDYVIKFPSVTITNETIHQESVSIKQAITGDGDLEFGGCIASTFEFEVSEVLTEELKGQEFTTELLVNNGNAARVKMGTYIAETVTQVDDNDYKKVVGYDAFYKMQDDVSDWYNSFFSNITQTTLKNFRQSLLLHFGVESEVQSLPNDNMIVTKTIDTTSNKITGQALLKMTCVLAGGFGIINRDGKFEITYLTSEPLYPEENLYPEETLYPEDGEFEYIGLNEDGTETFYPEYRSVTYEEYNVERISCLILKTNKSSITATIGTDTSNPYIISGNYLLYGKTTEELNTIGNNIVNKFTSVVGYRPCDITTDGMAWLDIGSQIALEKKNDDIVAYLFSRELKGIQALTDTISAKGNKYRDNQTSVQDDIEDLKNKDDELDEKTDEISDSIDEVSGNLDDLAEKTTVSLKKTEDSIEAEVTRASNAEGELSGRITVTADAVNTEVTRAKGAEETLSGRITVTAGEITQEVSRATSEENTLRASISLKIDKDDDGQIISMINESADVITLNSNRLIVNSSNFTLDRYGNVSLSGEVNASIGSIGEFNISNGALVSGRGTSIYQDSIVTGSMTSPSQLSLTGFPLKLYSPGDTGFYFNDQLFNPFAPADKHISLNSSDVTVTYSSVGNVKIENCQGFISEGSSGYGNLATVGYVKSKVSSDERIKKNIVDIPNVKDVYMDIPVYQFEYNGILERDGICFGTTAQGIERAFEKHKLDIDKYNIVQKRQPSVFNGEYKYIPTGDDLHYINWENINGMSVYMIQELVKDVETLKQEMEDLKSKLGGK